MGDPPEAALRDDGRRANEPALRDDGRRANEPALRDDGRRADEPALRDDGRRADEPALRDDGRRADEPALRDDGRRVDEMRPLEFHRDYTTMADGSALAVFGNTRVLCTASVEENVPRWLRDRGSGWLTAEYSMLPGSSPERVARRVGGRTKEIQRLIGRSLRTVVDFEALGPRQVIVDCDVLQADGGTRTAAICGGYLAVHDAVTRLVQAGKLKASPVLDECAAVSVGLIDGAALLDLPYVEDAGADVDFNVVMTGSGGLVEVQGTAEGRPFQRTQLDEMLDLAAKGISEIVAAQRAVLADPPPPR